MENIDEEIRREGSQNKPVPSVSKRTLTATLRKRFQDLQDDNEIVKGAKDQANQANRFIFSSPLIFPSLPFPSLPFPSFSFPSLLSPSSISLSLSLSLNFP